MFSIQGSVVVGTCRSRPGRVWEWPDGLSLCHLRRDHDILSADDVTAEHIVTTHDKGTIDHDRPPSVERPTRRYLFLCP